MSDIFKKAVAADLQKNFNVKNPTQVLEKNVVNKFETPTTPEPVTPSTPTKETKAPAVKTPTPPKSAAPAGTPITPENMDKFFGASPGVTQEQIQKAKPVPAIKKPLTQTKEDKAVLDNVQKQFKSKEILPVLPKSVELTGGLKNGEIQYLSYDDEWANRQVIQKTIKEGLDKGINLVTKQKLTKEQKDALQGISQGLDYLTKAEKIELGDIGTDDMSTWKRTSGNVFQQPIKPTKIIDTKSKKKLSDDDLQSLEMLAGRTQDLTGFQKTFFGEEYAKQEEEKKKEQYVFGKALESGKASDLIKEQEAELKRLEEELKKNEAELKEAEAEDLKTSQFEYEQNQSFFNTGVKYSPKAARLKAQNKVDQYSAVPELFAKNVNLQQQINSKKEVIANPFRKNKAETAAAGELFNYLNKQQELLLSPEEQKELAQTRAIQARQAVEEKFKRTGFRDANTSDKSSVMFYTNTGNTILIKKGDVKNVFKTIFNNAYTNISSSTDTKNLRTYAELAAYVTKFPNSEFSKKIQELGEEKGKALGFQGDWLPDVVKKRQAFDYQGNLGSTMGFSDDPIAIYAASLNPYDRSNPLLDKWKTTGYFSNFMKEFLVNSSLEADKNYIGAQRLNRQIEQDRYTLVTRPGLVKQIDEARASGDLKKAEELEYVLSTKEEKHRAFVEKNLKEDERDQTLLKSIEARTGTKGELGKEYAAKKEAGSTMYNLAQPTRDLLEFMAPVMIMELATMGMATPAVGALATQRTAAAIASRILKAAPTIYSRYNESTMEVGGAQTALYNEQLDDLLNKNGIELTASASTMDKEKALSNAGVTPEKLAIARLNTTVGSNSLFWKNMALAIPDLVQMDFLASTLLNTEKKIAEGALKVAAREKFLNLTVKGVGFKVPLKQTGNLALEGYLKSYLPEKFEEGIQYAFGKTYERDARGFNPPTFFNAMGSFVKDAFDAATSINFVPGVSHTNLGGTYSDDKEFQMSADIGGFLGGATAGLGIVKSTMNAAWSFNKAHNQLTEIGFYDPNFSVDRISAASFKALLDSGKLEYHMKLIADQKSKLQENGEVNKIYNYSKEDLRKIQDDPELENLKQLQAELGDRASSELNDTINFLQRETFLNKVYENGLSPSEQYDRFIAQLGRAQEIYNASLDNLSNVRSDKFFSSVNQDVRNFADTLSDAERTRYLKSFGGKTRIKNRLEQTIAEHAFSLARAEQDIKHVDKILTDFINKPNEKSFFDIPGLNQLFYDEMLVASKEDQLDTLEMMVDLDPNADPQLKERAKQFKKSLRAERLRINREFENIKSNLKEPLEGDTKKPSLKEQQQYLDQFVVSGEGFTRLNREKIRETQGLVDPVILDLMKEKSRRSDTATFANSQLEKLSKIKTASELGSWYNTSLTNVEKQLIKDRANRLKELEQKEEIITPEEEKEKAELRDALDIPEDATTEEVNAAIGDAISETESDVDPVAVTDTAIILDENFDFTALPSNPMTKVMLGSYPLANVRGIKTRIKNNEVFTITEVNNQQGYFKVITNDGKTTVMIPIKGGPLDGTSTVGTPVEPTSQEKLDDIVISVEAPTITVTDVPTTTEPVISEDIKNIQSTTVDQVLERLKILNSKKFKVNPEDENTYIEVDDNGTPVKDENGNVTVYARVSTLKGGDKPTDKKPANRGTIIDTLLRDFINNQFPSFESMLQAYNSNSLKNETQEFTPTFIKNLFDLFTDFKKSTDAAGIQLISDIPTLWGKLAGSTFAGTIDLMGIGKDGSVYIIDLKTAFRNRREVYENNDPSDRYYGFYVEGDSLQQSCYAELLRQRTGITISSLGILPIQITLENNKHTSAKPNMSKAGKFTIPVKINRTIFPEIIEPIEDQQEGPFTEPTIETPTVTPTVQPEVIATTQQTPITLVSKEIAEMFPESETFSKLDKPANRTKLYEKDGIGFAEYTNPDNGSIDIYLAGFGDNDFIGYIRVYENGKPTNRFTSKLERRTDKPGATKTMMTELQNMLPANHEFSEDISVSTDGIKFFANQLKQGYEVLKDKDGKIVTTRVAINGESKVNDLGVDIPKANNFDSLPLTDKKDFEKVKAILSERLKEFGITDADIKWASKGGAMTAVFNFPVLVKTDSAKPTVTQPTIETITQPQVQPTITTTTTRNIKTVEDINSVKKFSMTAMGFQGITDGGRQNDFRRGFPEATSIRGKDKNTIIKTFKNIEIYIFKSKNEIILEAYDSNNGGDERNGAIFISVPLTYDMLSVDNLELVMLQSLINEAPNISNPTFGGFPQEFKDQIKTEYEQSLKQSNQPLSLSEKQSIQENINTVKEKIGSIFSATSEIKRRESSLIKSAKVNKNAFGIVKSVEGTATFKSDVLPELSFSEKIVGKNQKEYEQNVKSFIAQKVKSFEEYRSKLAKDISADVNKIKSPSGVEIGTTYDIENIYDIGLRMFGFTGTIEPANQFMEGGIRADDIFHARGDLDNIINPLITSKPLKNGFSDVQVGRSFSVTENGEQVRVMLITSYDDRNLSQPNRVGRMLVKVKDSPNLPKNIDTLMLLKAIDAYEKYPERMDSFGGFTPEFINKIRKDYQDSVMASMQPALEVSLKPAEVENTIEDPFTIDEKFLGKLVYSSSTSGKSALASKSNNVTDADKLLEEAIEEAEPSINFSLMSEKEKKEALFNVYTIPGLYNKVKPLFINKIKDALAKKKLVVSANGMVREALPNELKIDYVFLHNDPSEFVKRSTDRGERAFNEKSAQTLFDKEKNRFPQADFYYPSGVTITDVVRSGSTVQMSVPSAIEEIPTPTAPTVQPTTEVMSTQPTPVKPRPNVDARLNLRYNFANGITVSRADREQSEVQQKEFLYGTEEDQLEFSILATESNPRIMKKFEAMGFKSNSKNIPIEMISDSDFNPNGLTESQRNALINGQPIIIAVNDVYGKRFRLGKDGQHSLNFGSPYTLVYIKPSRMGVEVNGVPQLDQSALTATLFNPNDFSTTELATLLKFSGDKSIASDETIRSFVTRFNNAIKLHKALNKIPSNTPLKLKDVKDIIKIKSSLGELNLINTRTNITNLPESMLYPFGKEKGIVIVNLNSDRSKTNYYNKDAITQMEANEINKIPLGNELGFKLIIKHSDPKKGLLYVDIDVPRGESPSTAGANLVGIIRGIVSEMVKKGISSNVSVSTYNGQMENIFGTHGKISITSTSLKGVFFNLKVQPDTMKFVLEVKTRRADGTYLFDSVGITELLASNIQSTEEFVKFLYDNLSNASLKALFEKPESFKISTVGVTIDAIIDTAQTRLSTTDPFKNPSIIANLVSDIESSTLANINMVKENVVSSLEDNTIDEGSEIDYVQQFEDNVLSLNQIAVTQLLKRNGKTLTALKEFIRENKVIVTEYDQIPDILTKMC